MQNGVLLITLVRLAKRMSEGPVEREHARRFDQHCQFPYQCQRNRCYTACLDFTRKQSYGPRADGSGGNQDHKIDLCLGKQSPNLTSRCKKITRILGEAKAVVDIGYATDDAFRLQFEQPFQREDQVQVAQGIPAVVVLMCNAQVRAAGAARNGAKRSIRLQFERPISTEMNASSGDDGHRCLCDGPFQRCPGNFAGWPQLLQPELQAPCYLAKPVGKMFSPRRIICQSQQAFSPTACRGESRLLIHSKSLSLCTATQR